MRKVRRSITHSKSSLSHIPTQSKTTGTKVSTPYGDGTISKYRPYNDTYDVELSFGHVFIGADSVKSENNTTNKKSNKKKKKSSYHKKSNDQDKMDVDESNDDKGLTTFIGDKSFYLYLRTYRCLYTAFANAKRLCAPRAVVPSTFIENRPVYVVFERSVRARSARISIISLFHVSIISLKLQECHSYHSLISARKSLENQHTNAYSIL